MTNPEAMGGSATRDLTRNTLSVLITLLLIVSCLWILRPFAAAGIWATMIVVTTWPVLLRLQRGLGGRRWAAVTVMTLVMLALFIVPLLLVVQALISNLDRMAAWVQATVAAGIPGPPSWMERVPLVGSKLASRWAEFAATPPAELRERLAAQSATIVRWIAATAGSVGGTVVQLLLTVIISAVLYSTGETAVSGVMQLARRLGGAHAEGAVRLAGQSVRAVALGVVGTALVQTVLAGIGLAVSGVPFAGPLTAVVFVTCIAQLGPIPILLPCVIYLYWSGSPGWGTFLAIWTLFDGTIDNVIRPLLIKRGADLSLLLIFGGVIGGLIAFGVVGLFVGPVLLAVTYTLAVAWVRGGAAARSA